MGGQHMGHGGIMEEKTYNERKNYVHPPLWESKGSSSASEWDMKSKDDRKKDT